jgi:hypothetical protein
LTQGQQAALRAMVPAGSDPAVDGESTWAVVDLCGIVRGRFGIHYSESGLAKLLHALDQSWQTPRPQHPESDAAGQAAVKGVLAGLGWAKPVGNDRLREVRSTSTAEPASGAHARGGPSACLRSVTRWGRFAL